MVELNYPQEVDVESPGEEGSRKNFKRDPNLFRMLPSEERKAAENRLFFLAFNLNRFTFFRHWPDMVNYYAKLAVHWVELAPADDSNFRRVMVACETQMNKHAKSLSRAGQPVPPVFDTDECVFCRHAQLFWDEYTEKRKAAGLENIAKDEFFTVIAQHPEVSAVRDLAKAWGPVDRYYFAVFDVAKALGQKPLEEEDGGHVRIQGYFGPDSIIGQLYRKQKLKKFWDFESGGYRVVNVTRDNTRGSQFCEYFIEIEDEIPNLPGEVVAYLQAAEDIPDPAQWVQVWTPEQKQAYVQSFGSGTPVRTKKFTTPPRPMAPTSVAFSKPVEPSAEVAPNNPVPRPVSPVELSPKPVVPSPRVPESVTSTPEPSSEPSPAPMPVSAPRRPKVTWR
jgi:hypothetical protein